MMIKSDNESHDDDHKPVETGASAKAIAEIQQDQANFIYHDIPHFVKTEIAIFLAIEKRRLFFQGKGIGGCPDKSSASFDFFDYGRYNGISFQLDLEIPLGDLDDL